MTMVCLFKLKWVSRVSCGLSKKENQLNLIKFQQRYFKRGMEKEQIFMARNKIKNGNKNMLFLKHKRKMGTGLTEIGMGKIILTMCGGVLSLLGMWVYLKDETETIDPNTPIDYEKVWDDIHKIMFDKEFDNSCAAPIILRLCFNQAATFSKYDKRGGTNGATMRFDPEASYPHNKGFFFLFFCFFCFFIFFCFANAQLFVFFVHFVLFVFVHSTTKGWIK